MLGTYKAWLSVPTSSPATRFTQNPGPYVLRNGTRIANNWADLVDGTLLAPINFTEYGQPAFGDTSVWTGTTTEGYVGGPNTCANWDSSSEDSNGMWGRLDSKDLWWTNFTTQPCWVTKRLYCFQQS
jgi:hypothetical protein